MSCTRGRRRPEPTPRRCLGAAALTALALLVTACGASDPASDGAAGAPSPSGVRDRAPAPPPLPGGPSDLGPRRGDRVAVVGVPHGEVVEVRTLPGADQPALTTLPPTATGVRALGRSRVLAGSVWTLLRTGEGAGWVPLETVAHLGVTTDETATAQARLGPDVRARSLQRLGRKVATAFATEDPASSVAMVRPPGTGAVTFDVVGLGDDSLHGLRLQVFGTPPDGDRPVTLVSVEQTTLCARGVDPRTRLCV